APALIAAADGGASRGLIQFRLSGRRMSITSSAEFRMAAPAMSSLYRGHPGRLAKPAADSRFGAVQSHCNQDRTGRARMRYEIGSCGRDELPRLLTLVNGVFRSGGGGDMGREY